MKKLCITFACLLAFPALAQETKPANDNPFAGFFEPNGPDCFPLSDFAKVAPLVPMSPSEFQFARGLYVATPPPSHTLPPFTKGYFVKSGEWEVALLAEGKQVCGRFGVPAFLHSMFEELDGRPL